MTIQLCTESVDCGSIGHTLQCMAIREAANRARRHGWEIRKAALMASASAHGVGQWTVEEIVADARGFEAYLRGEERN